LNNKRVISNLNNKCALSNLEKKTNMSSHSHISKNEMIKAQQHVKSTKPPKNRQLNPPNLTIQTYMDLKLKQEYSIIREMIKAQQHATHTATHTATQYVAVCCSMLQCAVM